MNNIFISPHRRHLLTYFIVLLIPWCMCINKVQAQEESQCDSVPYKCKWDLRDSIYTVIDVLKDGNARIYGISNTNFKDVNYKLNKDNCDTQNDSCSSDPNILKYHVYLSQIS